MIGCVRRRRRTARGARRGWQRHGGKRAVVLLSNRLVCTRGKRNRQNLPRISNDLKRRRRKSCVNTGVPSARDSANTRPKFRGLSPIGANVATAVRTCSWQSMLRKCCPSSRLPRVDGKFPPVAGIGDQQSQLGHVRAQCTECVEREHQALLGKRRKRSYSDRRWSRPARAHHRPGYRFVEGPPHDLRRRSPAALPRHPCAGNPIRRRFRLQFEQYISRRGEPARAPATEVRSGRAATETRRASG